MHTKDRLSAALKNIGLDAMAANAAQGLYDDFLSELDFPLVRLARELTEVGTPEALALRQRVTNGDFDSTREEAEAWAESEDGQNVLRRFVDDMSRGQVG